jgi:hypothetical protein
MVPAPVFIFSIIGGISIILFVLFANIFHSIFLYGRSRIKVIVLQFLSRTFFVKFFSFVVEGIKGRTDKILVVVRCFKVVHPFLHSQFLSWNICIISRDPEPFVVVRFVQLI